MGKRSFIGELPDDVRRWLEHELQARNFSGYSELTDELGAKLEAAGLELRISRSSLHRFGQSFESQVAALKETTLQAQMLRRELGDDAGELTDAMVRVATDRMYRLFMEGAVQQKDLPKFVRAAADITKAAVQQKKHQIEVSRRAAAAAEAVEQIARKGGLSAEAVDTIRREILGIAE